MTTELEHAISSTPKPTICARLQGQGGTGAISDLPLCSKSSMLAMVSGAGKHPLTEVHARSPPPSTAV